MKTHAERWKSKRALEKSLPMPHSARNSILGGRNSFATAFMTDINDSRSRLITTLLKIDNEPHKPTKLFRRSFKKSSLKAEDISMTNYDSSMTRLSAANSRENREAVAANTARYVYFGYVG